MWRIVSILILWLLAFFPRMICQEIQKNNFRFINFSLADGLPDKAVYGFTQDAIGFIWVGTASGLYRYDGNAFQHFKSDLETDYKQISNILQLLLFDPSLNRIWLRSTTDFQYFDLDDYKFHRISEDVEADAQDMISNESVTSMIKVDTHLLWLGGAQGIKSFNNSTNKWSNITAIFTNPHLGFSKSINKMEYITPDSIIIATTSHLVIYNPIKKETEYIKSIDEQGIQDFIYDPGFQCIWIATGLNLIKLNLVDKVQTIIKRSGLENMNFTYYKMSPFGKNKIWIAGPVIYDKQSGVMTKIPFGEGKYDNQLLYVNSIFVDRQNNLWRGSYESSCSVLPYQNHEVLTYPMLNIDDGIYNGANLEVLKCLKIKDQPFILVAANPLKGIIKLNIETGEQSLIKNGIHPMSIYGKDIIQANDGQIYFADNRTRYIVLPDQNRLTPITDLRSATHDSYIGKLLSVNPNLLIESSEEYLSFINLKSGGIKTQRFSDIDDHENKFENYYFRPLLMTQDSVIFYATPGGLFQQDHVNAPILKSEIFSAESGKKLLKPYDMIEDNQGNYWVTSLVNGLFKYDPKAGKLINFNSSNSALSSDYLTDLALQDKSRLFIGSTSEVYIFDTETNGYLSSFSKQNGFTRDDSGYQLSIQNNKWFIKNNYGSVDILDLEQLEINSFNQKPIITSFKVLNKEMLTKPIVTDTSFYLGHTENFISLDFASLNYSNSNRNRYSYKLSGINADWISSSKPSVSYSRLPPGRYQFEVFSYNNDGIRSEERAKVKFNIKNPFWKSWWFYSLVIITIGLLLGAFYLLQINKIKTEEKLKTDFKNRLNEIEMKALRAQMNPHFIFNSLNSIQKFIFEQDDYIASQYLTKFARLIRIILEHSDQNYITLSEEIDLLKLYIDLESMRFSHSFTYSIHVDKDLNLDTLIPSMVVQPHIENAIWHGLIHLPDDASDANFRKGKLEVIFSASASNALTITIRDNGIGREMAGYYKSKQVLKKKSFGSDISSERIRLFNELHQVNAKLNIEDLYDAAGRPIGTEVTITLSGKAKRPMK